MKDVSAGFRERFGHSPAGVVRAPGRVNLIGEHTDYNDGFVLPLAIDREIRIAWSPRNDRTVRVRSLDFADEAEFSLAGLERGEGWAEYLKGVAWALQEEGLELRGFDGVMSGDVPRGAGLSSSAALELATARAFSEASRFAWDPRRMALAGQRAENKWVGVSSGIMDQLISSSGIAGHALLIDCRSLETRAVPLPPDTVVVVLDTGTRRSLVGSAYNERRERCEEAARHFGAAALRDVTPERLAAEGRGLSDITFRRARHVVTENERTLRAAEAMARGDARSLGELMNASHASLRDDFEVSSDALDAVAACAREHPACFGARMTGAGFGGCAVALLQAEAAYDFSEQVARCYHSATGREARIMVCRASDGASTAAG